MSHHTIQELDLVAYSIAYGVDITFFDEGDRFSAYAQKCICLRNMSWFTDF